MNKLSPKRKAFIIEFLKDQNATQAAIRAGYSVKTAEKQAGRILADRAVQDAIRKHQDKALNNAEVSLEWWIRKVKQLADYDPRRYFDESGNLLPIAKLDDESASALAGIEVVELEKAQGLVKKIKFSDRRAALDLLGKYLGVYGANNKLEIGLDVNRMTDEQVESIASSLLKKIQ